MSRLINKKLPLCCLLLAGMSASTAQAGWYDNDPDINKKQGFGDFPPANIEQDLQQYVNKQNGVIENDATGPAVSMDEYDSDKTASSENSASSEASSQGYAYQPVQYPVPAYGGYAPVMAPGYGTPWLNRGPVYQSRRNNRGSFFNPFGGRGGFW